jgi:hypothetical protein
LKENQTALNEADVYNHNHGDNMVKNFQVITKALREKKDSTPAEQLEYASQSLARRSQTGSAQLYAQGLAQAANRYRGQAAVTPDNALLLVQSLMGGQQGLESEVTQGNPMSGLLGALLGGQQASATAQAGTGGDAMSSLLGGLLGGQMSSTVAQPAAGGDDLSGLLGGLLGGGSQPPTQTASSQGGLNLNSLLSAAMSFMQYREQGAEPMQALIQALMSGSQMNNTTHHSQSGQLVAGTLLNSIGAMLSGKKR